MKRVLDFVVSAVVSGLLVLVPVYLALLLLLKAAASLAGLMKPLAGLLPAWLPAERVLSIMLVLVIAFLIGAAGRTQFGSWAKERLERTFFERIPGYALFRSLTQQIAGRSEEKAWKPALVEIEDALVPGFIIEEHADGQYTVFVPSVPTPLAGAVYVLPHDRVHKLDIPFTQAIKSVSRWGSGCEEMVAAMKG